MTAPRLAFDPFDPFEEAFLADPDTHHDEPYPAGPEDASLIWEGRKAGRDIGYCHLEKLHNLEVPAERFTASCFPHKIRGASAGWNRAVAVFDD